MPATSQAQNKNALSIGENSLYQDYYLSGDVVIVRYLCRASGDEVVTHNLGSASHAGNHASRVREMSSRYLNEYGKS